MKPSEIKAMQEMRLENRELLKACAKWMGKAAHFEAENEKLRAYLTLFASHAGNRACDFCAYDYCMSDMSIEPMREGCQLHDDLLELGIEVGK